MTQPEPEFGEGSDITDGSSKHGCLVPVKVDSGCFFGVSFQLNLLLPGKLESEFSHDF